MKLSSADTSKMLTLTPQGLYCPSGDFYIDPWQPVPRAVITHGHSDHARSGSENYWAAASSFGILSHRLGKDSVIEPHPFGEVFQMNDVAVSFHPAGHVLGSAQVLMVGDGLRVVVSGDYKRDPDPSCEAFEVVPCDVFVTEATFALPIYRWEAGEVVASQIFEWWEECARHKKNAILYGYSLGKAQRILAELAKLTDKAVYLHGAMRAITQVYRDAGITMLPTKLVNEVAKDFRFEGELVLAPPSAHRTSWIKRFGDFETAFASGWMRVRGAKRRKGYDRGFVLSDHADWPSLLETIAETGARKILVTHGRSDLLVRYLQENGTDAEALETFFGDEAQEDAVGA